MREMRGFETVSLVEPHGVPKKYIVKGDRRKHFEGLPGPKGVSKSVRAATCRERLAQTSPKEWAEDPYFMCHLLGLAQLQEQWL
ncbi:hypothetical protein N7490_006247 [Penicillium lividum]|nr:hypothetical protein N7490_006247 [Penicillium lividum]